jgi:butyryl-CoA dehydrogenase
MLLFQKAVTEGSLSLLIEAARLYDISRVAEGRRERERSPARRPVDAGG